MGGSLSNIKLIPRSLIAFFSLDYRNCLCILDGKPWSVLHCLVPVSGWFVEGEFGQQVLIFLIIFTNLFYDFLFCFVFLSLVPKRLPYLEAIRIASYTFF